MQNGSRAFKAFLLLGRCTQKPLTGVCFKKVCLKAALSSNCTQAVVPHSGTSLFADIWIVPSGAQGGTLQVSLPVSLQAEKV